MTVIPFTTGSTTESIDAATNPADFYQVELIAGVDYVATVSGASTAGGTLQDPFIGVLDTQNNVIEFEDDESILGVEISADPVLEFSVPITGTYFLGVGDNAVSTGASDQGTYTFVFDQAGPPVFFGGLDGFSTFNS